MKRRLIVIAALCFAALDALFDMGPEKVIDEIRHERAAQDRQWGGHAHDTGHSPMDWMFILAKHMGKLAHDVGEPVSSAYWGTLNDARDAHEAIEVAGRRSEQVI